MKAPSPILRIAIPTPLRTLFDYLPPAAAGTPQPAAGQRVRVPFGRGNAIGVIIEIGRDSTVERRRLKRAGEILDDQPLLPPALLRLLTWAAGYYHHPIGQVIFAALPAALRQGRALPDPREEIWLLTAAGRAIDPATLSTRAPRQAELLALLEAHPDGAGSTELSAVVNWRSSLRGMIARDWVVKTHRTPVTAPPPPATPSPAVTALNPAQAACVEAIHAALGHYHTFLLEGVTGSGKTEVYLAAIEQVVARGQQALILVPEIGLTPQLVARFRSRFPTPVVILHSGLNDRERLVAWHAAATGAANIVIGTRSALLTPLPQAGLIIIDEEHDPSFKQQDGFRYHARDLAIMRAHEQRLPVVLGSATPSLESLHNAAQHRYTRLSLPARHGDAALPRIRLIDLRSQPMEGILSRTLLEHISAHLAAGNQVLLFLNRRGYAPTLICHSCGWLARCERCDAHLIYHQRKNMLRCHHCDASRPLYTACPECHDSDLRPLGFGTERVEETLAQHFPNNEVIRIDRDSTRHKDSMTHIYERVRQGCGQILLGTQMLAKGHDLPHVTLAAILDADQGLFGIDFRASERMGQLILQVAGRAGRAERPGEVMIQTHHPDHPMLQTLSNHDYRLFADNLLAERRAAGLPPFAHLALFRAEAGSAAEPLTFLSRLRQLAATRLPDGVQLLGPVPAVMERRAGRYRAQLLLQATTRGALHRLVEHCLQHIHDLPQARRIRWAIDIDPQDTS